MSRPRLVVSACLLGQAVRYDGGHRQQAFCTGLLAVYADLIPLCPELAIGLGVPRPPIQLVGDPARPRLLGVADPGRDLTDAMAALALEWARHQGDYAGLILKQGSPSCGLAGVKLCPSPGEPPAPVGVGLFARTLGELAPELPLAAEDWLEEPDRRHQFLSQVFARQRWKNLLVAGATPARLGRFHARHRYQILAHCPQALGELEGLVREPDGARWPLQVAAYGRLFQSALACQVSVAALSLAVAGLLEDPVWATRRFPARRDPGRVLGLDQASVSASLARIRERLACRPQDPLRRQTLLFPYPLALAPATAGSGTGPVTP